MAKKVTELECWRLANELRAEVVAICAQPKVAQHFRYCSGFTEAAGSVCHNISEGFARYHSGPIVQFFGYALASLSEVEDYLREGLQREFIDQTRVATLEELAQHARAKTLKFMRYHEAKLLKTRKKSSPR